MYNNYQTIYRQWLRDMLPFTNINNTINMSLLLSRLHTIGAITLSEFEIVQSKITTSEKMIVTYAFTVSIWVRTNLLLFL